MWIKVLQSEWLWWNWVWNSTVVLSTTNVDARVIQFQHPQRVWSLQVKSLYSKSKLETVTTMDICRKLAINVGLQANFLRWRLSKHDPKGRCHKVLFVERRKTRFMKVRRDWAARDGRELAGEVVKIIERVMQLGVKKCKWIATGEDKLGVTPRRSNKRRNDLILALNHRQEMI